MKRASPSGPQLTPKLAAPGEHPFDRMYRTKTSGLVPKSEILTGGPGDEYLTAYYAVAPSIFHALLQIWGTRCDLPTSIDRYTFLDIGAGKGRAMLLAAENPFASVLAIERNPRLAEIARANLRCTSAELLAPVQVLEEDALGLQLPDGPCVLFLFHPFEAPAMRRFARRLAAQRAGRPAPLDLLYVNAEHSAVLDKSTGFRCLWRGRVPMSTEDHLADLAEIAQQEDYGSTGDETCAIYRLEPVRTEWPGGHPARQP